MLTVLDKRAIVNRYEALTGKRLITWAGESSSPSANKPEFAGLRCLKEMLYAETPHTDLTLKEVAQELCVSEEEVKKIIGNGWLDDREDSQGQSVITKDSLRGFKDYAMRDGISMRLLRHKFERPNTAKGYTKVNKELEAIAKKQLPDKLRKITERAFERSKKKNTTLI